ncbi:MAG: hypothetical protein IT214_01750 [Chitinophagaceae bacterium]|nr:hypothetical protein [Chitinophagaceae bacterium]
MKQAKTTQRQCTTVLSQAKKGIPVFALAYAKFIEKTTLEQSSKGLIVNYSRSLAYVALHFGRGPHQVSMEEINAYLYSMSNDKTTVNFLHFGFGKFSCFAGQ